MIQIQPISILLCSFLISVTCLPRFTFKFELLLHLPSTFKGSWKPLFSFLHGHGMKMSCCCNRAFASFSFCFFPSFWIYFCFTTSCLPLFVVSSSKFSFFCRASSIWLARVMYLFVTRIVILPLAPILVVILVQ